MKNKSQKQEVRRLHGDKGRQMVDRLKASASWGQTLSDAGVAVGCGQASILSGAAIFM